MLERTRVRLDVNGARVERDIAPDLLLLDFLRDELGLTGTKGGCGVGVCGLCTVLADGVTISSCLLPAVCAQGQELWTIEGLAQELLPPSVAPPCAVHLAAVQEAMLACDGLQCGICTAGQVLAACELLGENGAPTEAEVRHHLAGSLCRCTGYRAIVRAVERASERTGDEHAP